MAHQMIVTLNDDEYAALSTEAARTGKPLESLIHDAVAQQFPPVATRAHAPTRREIEEYLYREALTENIPTREQDTPEELAERQRLAALFGQGAPASEMVIEDRGPR